MVMRILKTSRRQDAVYWPPAGVGDDANPVYGDPVPMKVRWVDTQELLIDNRGSQFVSRSKVDFGEEYVVQVDGVFWKGKLADVPSERLHDPLSGNFGAGQVRVVTRVPTLDGKQEYCQAVL